MMAENVSVLHHVDHRLILGKRLRSLERLVLKGRRIRQLDRRKTAKVEQTIDFVYVRWTEAGFLCRCFATETFEHEIANEARHAALDFDSHRGICHSAPCGIRYRIDQIISAPFVEIEIAAARTSKQ